MLALKSQEVYKVPLEYVEEFEALAEKTKKDFASFLRENLDKEIEENDKEDN